MSDVIHFGQNPDPPGVVRFGGLAAAAAGGAAGTPAPVQAALLWDWNPESLALSDDAPVAALADSSPNGYDLAQATEAARPTFKTAILNAKPVLRFASGDYLKSVDVASADLYNAFTQAWVFVVAKSTAATLQSIVSHANLASVTHRLAFTITSANAGRWSAFRNDLAAQSLPFTETGLSGAWRVLEARRDGVNNTVWRDGVQENNTTSATQSATAWTAAIYLGALNDTPLEPFVGDVARVLVYTTLSGVEQTEVRAYIETEYGLPAGST